MGHRWTPQPAFKAICNSTPVGQDKSLTPHLLNSKETLVSWETLLILFIMLSDGQTHWPSCRAVVFLPWRTLGQEDANRWSEAQLPW
jgi:hypothetical protein